MEARNYGNLRKLIVFLVAFVASLALLVYLAATTVLTEPIRQWTPTTGYPFALANRNAVVHGDFVYVVGGKAGDDQPTNQVRFAKINVDGSLGTWDLTASLPYPVYLHATAASDDYLYAIGGSDGGTTLYTNVMRAPFLNDGQLGQWIHVGDYPDITSDFVGIDLLEALVIEDNLYVFGGWDGKNKRALTDVFYAEIRTNALSAWQTAESLPLPTARFAVAYYDGYVYSTGGSVEEGVPDTEYKEVYYSKVNGDGSLGVWTPAASLPDPVYYHQAVIHDGKLVVLGGRSKSQVYDRILSSAIRSDGGLEGWAVEGITLPEPLYRFASVSLPRLGSDYLYLIGGLTADDSYRNNVYHSDVPPTLTPTLTPGISLSLSNDPTHWIAPGEEVEYTISLAGNEIADFSDVRLSNTIPDQTELIEESIMASGSSYKYTGEEAGSIIEWRWPTFAADGAETVSYSVRRKLPPTPDVSLVMSIDMVGPATANAGDPIRYALTVKNNVPISLPNVIAEDVMPLGAIYVSGGDQPPVDGVVQWAIPLLAPFESVELELIVTASQTVINSRFSVRTEGGAYIQGQDVIVTVVDDTPPPPSGDGTAIINSGATVRWTAGGQEGAKQSNGVRNPMFDVFLPSVSGR